MPRLILATVLITVVYSWEDLKWTLINGLKSVLRQKNNPRKDNDLDQIVGTALILALIPANLVFLLVTPGNLIPKLLMILTELLLVGLIAEVTEIIFSRARDEIYHQGIWVFSSQILMGLVSPSFRFLGQLASQRQLFLGLIRALAFPLVFGLGLKFMADKFGADVLEAHSDTLVSVAVAALIISLTIQLLEKFFRKNRMHLFTYFRILLGIVIIVILGNYLV